MKIIDEREMKNNNNNDNKIKKIIKITRGKDAIAKRWEISDFVEHLS